MIFFTFGNNIGCLLSLFKNDFPIFLQHGSLHLHPRMDQSEKSCFSRPAICLGHWGFPQILTIDVNLKALLFHHFYQSCFCFLQQTGVKQSCTFYFPYDVMLIHLGQWNFLEFNYYATTLTILDKSDIRFSRGVKTSSDFVMRHTTNSFFNSESFLLTGGIILLSSQAASGSQRNCGPRYHLLTLSSLQTSILRDA